MTAEEDAVESLRARKDAAFLERNKVVVALAKLFPSGRNERGLKPMERQLEFFDTGYAAGQGLTVLTFEEAWKRMEAKGYRYGHDALEGVRFGWELAHGMHMEPKVEKPDPLLQGPGAGAYAMAGGNGYGRGL